ncbi:DNA glycosylase [Punctularia strigosozonata HHB-11173 SS5]|uniref:DNA glycosylase n=1 Tax=Punctularia strigosozonata (strain HHB-11173) TaxID=741275 RepID=UPI000441784A|nr:DNA glycosylase [Punctularia strigosozonata HHB-11173 SS5]EIN09422.1 DNA glycosylase [Punctularia strigosozonata HHB-11173 SS5]
MLNRGVEKVASDPWKVLIATMLLNKTAGRTAIPIFWKILDRWPSPQALSNADVTELTHMIKTLGLQSMRAKRLIQLSEMYLAAPPDPSILHKSRNYPVATPVSHLPGSGRYALDSYRIFCNPGIDWMNVMPTDKELIKYIRWKWATVGRRWDPDRGPWGYADLEYWATIGLVL